MKRWIFLILVGVVFLLFAISNILVIKELDFNKVGKIIISFIIGFVSIVIGIVYIQKRTLELLIENTDARKRVDVKSLIFNKKVYNQGPKIVVLGGGAGLNNILKGLKYYTDNITAIVTVSDYGETVNDSRRLLATLPLGDVKESIISLATDEEAMRGIIELKFESGRLQSLSFGDIFLLAMNEYTKDFTKSIEKTKDILNMTGKVLPVTLEEIKVCAELEDGTVIENKNNIPDIVNSKTSKISRVFINPHNCKPAPGVMEAIMEADAIVIAPGSLYTNIIPNLLVKGVSKAIRDSKAFKIYVSNLMTEPGQTYNYSLSDHINAINNHAGGKVIDYCIYDTGEIVPEYIRKYNMQGYELIEQDIQKVKNQGIKLMQRSISCVQSEYIRHDSKLVAQAIIELVCEDLKFKDKQNDLKYMLLNDRLKSSKKHNKRIQRNKIKQTKKNPQGKSKFFSKYQDRIESIKESDMKLKEKERLNKIQEKLRKRPGITKGTKKINANKTEKTNEIQMQMPNKIDKLDENERKKIIETINKLRR
ncbi:MAG: YvcK family protein [Clostridia bacterium]|nr:YvcK family protein [Clostridia bacterium]